MRTDLWTVKINGISWCQAEFSCEEEWAIFEKTSEQKIKCYCCSADKQNQERFVKFLQERGHEAEALNVGCSQDYEGDEE